MAIVADPNSEDSNFHVALTAHDGSKVGLIACDSRGEPSARYIRRSLYQGSNLYSKPAGGRFDDRQAPYLALENIDWSAGRGEPDYERNTSKFFDSKNLWSATRGKVYPAPQFQWTTGYRSMNVNAPSSVMWKQVRSSDKYIAWRFSVGTPGWTAAAVHLTLRYFGRPQVLTVYLYTNNSGVPGTVMGTATTIAYTDMESEMVSEERVFNLTTPLALTAATDYWVYVYSQTGDNEESHWEVAVKAQAGSTKKSTNGSTWTDAPYDLYTTVGEAWCRGQMYFYEYKRAMYALVTPDDISTYTPKLYINGYRGIATGAGQSTTKLVDTDKSFVVNSLVGKTVTFVQGTGEGVDRVIASNTATEIVPTAPFDLAPVAGSTVYVILGIDTWTSVTDSGTGTTLHTANPVTDRPLPCGENVYFMRGESAAIRRMNEYVNAGAWTRRFADDSTNKGVKAAKGKAPDGAFNLFVGRNTDANNNVSVSRGLIPQTWTDLALNLGKSPMQIGDHDAYIRAMIYQDAIMFVLKDDGLYGVANDLVDLILGELRAFRSQYTGKSIAIKTPYIYYNMAQGFTEQFYAKQQSNMGPNSGEGLPLNRRGIGTGIIPAGPFLIQAYDAGPSGYSAVFLYNDAGWHEIYRAPYGERIRDIWFQSIYGQPSRLWIAQDRVIGYLQFPEAAVDPEQDTRIKWAHEGVLITGWMSDNTLDIDKFWAHLKLFTENLSSTCKLYVEYQTDNADYGWQPFLYSFENSPSEEQFVGNRSAVGKRIRFRIRFITADNTKHGVLKSVVPDYVAKMPVNYAYNINFLVAEEEQSPIEDLNGDEATFTAIELTDFLERAKFSPIPLTMECVVPEFHDKKVLLDPATLQILDIAPGEAHRLVGSMRLLEAA